MNVPTITLLYSLLQELGTDTTRIGNGSIGLISAPFTPNSSTTLGILTEANYNGYSRKSIGTSSVTFTGGDGKAYVEFSTLQFIPSGSSTPNTIYGAFVTFGNSTTTLVYTEAFSPALPMASTSNQITITPRFGLDPAGNYGLDVVSN